MNIRGMAPAGAAVEMGQRAFNPLRVFVRGQHPSADRVSFRSLSVVPVFSGDTTAHLVGKAERLQLVFDQLQAMPLAQNGLVAYHQLSFAMKAVEDRYTDKPYDPTQRMMQHTRMYPPMAPESPFQAFAAYPGVTHMPTHGHHMMIGRNGAIEIQSKPNPLKKQPEDKREIEDRRDAVVYRRAGANGLHLWEDPINRLP